MLFRPRLVAVAAAVAGGLMLAGCGGGGDSSGSTDTTSPAEAHNAAILGEAESNAESVAAIEEELDYRLAPLEYSGVDTTFVTTDGDYCTLGEIYAGEELALYKNDKNTLLSPNGNIGVSVGTFQGTQDAPCLKAVSDALGWGSGEDDEPVPSGSLSKQQFVAQMDEICKTGNDEVDGIFASVESYEDEARAQSEARPGYVERVEALQALKPPASLSAPAAEYVALLEEQIELNGEAQDAAALIDAQESIGESAGVEKDKKEYEKYESLASKNFDKRQAIGQKIGATNCAPEE